jgi:alanine racemase
MLLQFLRQLIKPRYDTLNRIEIKADFILDNLAFLQKQQEQAEMIPVLKANAYGHGLKEMCLILNKSGVKMLAVDSFPEAQIVYRYFKGRVLLIGEMPLEAYAYLNWQRTDVCIYNQATLRKVFSLNKKASVHIFVNSGMNREGIKDLPVFWRQNKEYLLKMNIAGFCSHLAEAEGDGSMNEEQKQKFFSDLDFIQAQGLKPKYIHLANSAGIFSLKDRRLTACRPGLSLYGYNPFQSNSPYFELAQQLKPALRVISKVISLQDLKAGETVSYNAKYVAQEDTRVAIIPFGYYEGLDRALSNLLQLKYEDSYLKVIGNICMNLTCLEVKREQRIAIGSEITLISDNLSDLNSVSSIASLQKVLIYEVLVKLQANIRRIIV